MPSCALRYCKSRYSATTGRDYSLFSFPSVKSVEREKWIRFVQVDRNEEFWLPSTSAKLCSKHFRSEDIYFGKTGRSVLKKGSIPCIRTEVKSDDAPTTTQRVTPVNVYVSDSDSIFDTPRKIALKTQIINLEKQKIRDQAKIKKLGHQNKYLKRKILNLKDFTNHLEKKFDIQKNVLNSLKATAESEAIFDRLSKKSTKGGLSRRI